MDLKKKFIQTDEIVVAQATFLIMATVETTVQAESQMTRSEILPYVNTKSKIIIAHVGKMKRHKINIEIN